MSRIVYVNGEYLAEEQAKISIFDRGFLFADGVYEVTSVLQGKLIDNPGHIARLERSLKVLSIPIPLQVEEIIAIQKSLIQKNALEEGLVYLQVTRGSADRDFLYPENAKPSLVMFTQIKDFINSPLAQRGAKVITTPDIRWLRRDIKTVSLLAASMAKMEAKQLGADEAWMVEDGYITEGSSCNAYIITKEGKLITRQLGTEILPGITRITALRLARDENIEIEERAFSVEEAEAASEAFITSATTFVTPVVSINGKQLGNGKPGPISSKLRKYYIEAALSTFDDA